MSKFYKQRDSFSCGPVAILNALSWFSDKAIPYSYVKFISLYVKCVPIWGTQNATKMEKFLRLFGIKVGRRVKIKISEVDKHLDKGGTIILRYVRKEINDELFLGHYLLIVKKENNRYFCANNKNAYGSVSRKTMIKYLKIRKDKYLRTWMPWGILIYPPK